MEIIEIGVESRTVRVGLLGAGPRTVVLSNQSNEDLCPWLGYARTLAAAGMRVVVWNYAGGAAPADELAAIVAELRARGATSVVLMGASKGAKVSIVAAAQVTPPVAGVVCLSAEDVLRPSIDIPQAATGVRSPLLLITAAHDPYGSTEAGPEILAAAPSTDKHLITVDGSDHGTALLSGPAAARVLPAVAAFLQRVTAG